MRVSAFPKNPSKVLTKSLRLGLSATAYLAKTRITKTTKHLYEGGKGCKGIKKVLVEAKESYYKSKMKGRPNASHFKRIENNIRRSHHKIIFNTSVPYGNTEVKRKRRKEDRKYINILADYYGAQLRNLGAEKFPFPQPMKTITDQGKTKWVYPGNSRTPEFSLTHTAAELDFVDMIRCHGLGLIQQCMKYSVPMREARRYLDTLVERLTPYLEYVYSEQKSIESGFVRGSAKVLREIILEIRTTHGGVNGRSPSITEEVSQALKDKQNTNHKGSSKSSIIKREFVDDNSLTRDDLDSFFSDLADNSDISSNPSWKKHVVKLRAHIKNGLVRRDDAKFIVEDLREQSRMMGSAFHDFISNSEFTIRPFSFPGILTYGDEMATEKSEFLFTCEVSIANGRGRVDILLFRRKKLRRADDSRTEFIWEPCMLVELKSKCFYNLDLYATPTKSQNKDRRVVEPVYELRKSDTDEWRDVISATPTLYEQEQLNAYEKEVIASYTRYARRDADPPSGLMKAVLVVDLKENWETLRDHIKDLILKAYHKSESAALSKRDHFHLSPEWKVLRMGLVVFSDSERRGTSAIKKVKHFDPFYLSKGKRDNREFILYLTISGKGSPSESAARIAAKWNGLEFIKERVEGQDRDVFWFDFAGDYTTPKKRKRILRNGLQSDDVRDFLKREISFIDMADSISSYLQGVTDFSKFHEKIENHFEDMRRPFIVVTGFDKVRPTTARNRRSLIDGLMVQFLSSIPEHAVVLWFDRPVPVSRTSQRYDTRSIAPFYNESPWVGLVDEIIYNVPIAPMRYGSYVPVEDDIRWLVTERVDGFNITPVLTPPLYKWGERFRPDRERTENIRRRQEWYLRSAYSSTRQVHSRVCEEEDEESILELIPHLQRFYEEKLDTSEKETNETIIRELLPTVPSQSPSFLSRIIFTPYQYLTSKKRDRRMTRLESFGRINCRREYRTTRLYGQPRKVTTQPPHVSLLKHQTSDLVTIVRRELSGIRRVVKILRKRHGEKENWSEFLDSLGKIVDRKHVNLKSSTDILSPLRVLRVFLETHSLSRRVWFHLEVNRKRTPQGLSSDQELVLKRLTSQHPDMSLIMGNQLFLILLAALYETNELESRSTVTVKLWEHLVPWLLISLGFGPEYPPRHQTGKSVLHRPLLIDRLARRAKALIGLNKSDDVNEVHFGKAVLVEEKGRLTSLLLIFQARPNSQEMNTVFIRLPLGSKRKSIETIRGLCRERPFWGESDLIRLGKLSDSIDLDNSVDIMVATHKDVRGLWVLNEKKNMWLAIGRMDYYTRRREKVTLLMSMTLREDTDLEDIREDKVWTRPSDLQNMVEVGFGLVSAVFRGCETVRCQVSIDTNEQMFRVSFLRHARKKDKEIAYLMIKHTVDVLEVLRRPDFQCEQVVASKHELIWNRFNDIEYIGDARILKPWVERREPFKTADLSLPECAEQLTRPKKKVGLKLSVLHDRETCPLCLVSEEVLKQRIKQQGTKNVRNYLQLIEGEQGQPDEVLSESVYRHGVCWRVQLMAEDNLPDAVKSLEKISLSGPALGTLLKTGALVYKDEGEWVIHEFDVPRADQLPREFRESNFLVQAYREIVPRALRELKIPGTYLLKREERWIVSLNFQRDHIIWSARSDVTGATYKGESFTTLLTQGMSLEDMTDTVINHIMKTLPSAIIKDLDAVREHVMDMLRSLGYRSENLYVVEVRGEGDLVEYSVALKDSESYDYGSIKVSERMTPDEVFEKLKHGVDRIVMKSKYEMESSDEVRESLSAILREIAGERGWEPIEDTSPSPPLDPLTAAIEYGRMKREVEELREGGKSHLALKMVEKYLEMMDPEVRLRPSLRVNFLEALILKVEVLVSGEVVGSVEPRVLLNLLDRVEEHSHHFETRVLQAKTEFGKKIRWALGLRDSFRNKTIAKQ